MEVEGIANGYFREAIEEPQTQEEPPKTVVQPAVSANGCFDCNICLDFAVDPVVTLCGHLYCWPCIYRWMQTDSVTVQQCPVRKASLSEDSLVPLYGRGHSTKRAHQTLDIPRRPNSYIHHRGQAEIEPEPAVVLSDEEENYITNRPVRHRHHHYHVHQHEHHHHYPHHGPSNDFTPLSPTLGTMTNRVIHSTAGEVLGGMAIAVLPWVFRNHQEAASMQLPSPSPYYAGANGGSPRQRRQEMEVESSLHQIWVFLFCCAMLCLLLF